MDSNEGDKSALPEASKLYIESDPSDFETDTDFESDSSDIKNQAVGNNSSSGAITGTASLSRESRGSRFGIRRKLLAFASSRNKRPPTSPESSISLRTIVALENDGSDIPEVEPTANCDGAKIDEESPVNEKSTETIVLLDNRRLEDIKVDGTSSTSATETTASVSASQNSRVSGLRRAFATLRIKDSSKRRTPVQRSNTEASRPIVVKQPRSSLDLYSAGDPSSLKKSHCTDPLECIQPILEEFIATEESYVTNLWQGINTYGQIFQRPDLPEGLQAKEYELLANVEAIATLHRDQLLPMLKRNHDHGAERIFTELQRFIEEKRFHIYVAYTINKRRSMQLIARHRGYFLSLEKEFGDRLGISSFLLEPIQRMARYPLLINQCISTLFKQLLGSNTKVLMTTCCRLETKLRALLNTINESESINDIVEFNVTNMFNSFRRVGAFEIYDHSRWRSYHGKLFLFDKCLLVTKIMGKQLLYRRRYSCDVVQVMEIAQGFSLFYGNRLENKCDFRANAEKVEMWLKLIQEVQPDDGVNVNADAESLEENDEVDYAPHDYSKVSEFQIYDHTLERKYPAKVFLFEKCIAYAEVNGGERMRLRGSYPFDHVGVSPSDESFTLFYDRRHQQECEFMGKPKLIKEWLDVIHGHISSHFKKKASFRGIVDGVKMDPVGSDGD